MLVELTKSDIDRAVRMAKTPRQALLNLYDEVIGDVWRNEKTERILEYPKVNEKTNDYILDRLLDKFGKATDVMFEVVSKGFNTDNSVPDWMADISDVKFIFDGSEKTVQEIEAYELGYEYGKDVARYLNESAESEEIHSEEDLNQYLSEWEYSFEQSSEYANYVAPELRRIAGCKDEGYGTYTDCDEDAEWNLDTMFDQFWEGFGDGVFENLEISFSDFEKRFHDFFVERFGKTPETDPRYADEWRYRINTGRWKAEADSESARLLHKHHLISDADYMRYKKQSGD